MDEICKQCRIKLSIDLQELLCSYCRTLPESDRVRLLRELYNLEIDET